MTYTNDLVDERIRSAVPDYDDSNWRDVRRRARRKAAPAVLAAGLIIAVLLAAPAVAFRSQLDDLWAQAEPEKNLYVRAVADCGEDTFTLEFDPERGAVVRQDGQTLARASLTGREIDCHGPVRMFKSTPDEFPYHGELDGRSDAATTVTCATDARLQIVINPIWFGSKLTGSTLGVAERATKRLIASAVFERDPGDGRNWSRTYWNSAVCSARP